MEGVQLIIQESGLMISAVPDGEDSEASIGAGREVSEQASGHDACKKAGRQAGKIDNEVRMACSRQPK